ncbi:MAG: glutathionylspermidine synthase family protein [Deltaproteobacteria bacterium]|nr:glutathionylspermidine synthase family protein [Myxococcales bacterium]MDP3213353.1 glutathionylspermidine synthase family protein [Deltaproteobacteria bacterium]
MTADERYDRFAARLSAGGVVIDPWLEGSPRFRVVPLVLPAERWRALARVGEQLAAVYDEVCAIVADDPALLEEFFGLTPVQRALWLTSQPLWHGIARADVFVTAEGFAVTELNSDTPTGEPEAVELGRLAAQDHPDLRDPNEGLRERFVTMAEALTAALVDAPYPRAAGIVYPTEFTEDLSLVRLYRKWLTEAGWEVVLGSPYNLGRDDEGRATLFDRPVSLLVRHYKTDWWTERSSAWSDETIPDAAPLTEALEAALGASVERKTAVLNPFGAVVPQNKRAMALMWEHVHRFSPASQSVIERIVPFSSRLESLHAEQVRVQREQWVLKSDFGAEGDEVVIGRAVTQEEWEKCLALARPGRWIAQRYFEAEAGADGETVNYGVFVVAGEAAGLYVRAQPGATDVHALSVPVLVGP